MSFRPRPMGGSMGYGFQGPPPGMMMGNRGPPRPMSGPPPPGTRMGGPPGPRQGPPPNMMPRHMGPRPNLPPNQNKSKLVPQEIEDGEIEKPPVTTVFVGSISERAPDTMVRTLLQRCGNIVSWKRVQGADGKLQAFGFCEFEVPEATLRCIRLLNEWPIAEKKLVVKVDDKTKSMLEDYEKAHEVEDSDVKREDRLALAALDAVMREFAAELRRNAPREQPAARHPREQYGVIASGPKADEGLDDVVKDEDAKNLINREISRFREAYKDDEVVTEIKPGTRDPKLGPAPGGTDTKEKSSRPDERTRESSSSRRRESPERRSRADRAERGSDRERGVRGGDRDRDRERVTERDRTADRERRPDRPDRAERGAGGGEEERRRRSRSRSRDRRERSPRKREEPDEDPDERYERLRMERQLRDKEQAYQERLKNWEVRERKKIREFERERQRSEERKAEEKKEARRLREFLEDYDDERDDTKYYKSHALTRRMKEREKEAEADARDRHKEREEIEELRKKLVEEGHPDPDAEINKRQNPDNVSQEESMDTQEHNSDNDISEVHGGSEVSRVSSSNSNHMHTNSNNHSDHHHNHHGASTSAPSTSSAHNDMSDSADSHRRKKLTVRDVFNDDDDASEDMKKKRPLVPLDYEDKKKPSKLSVEDKRAAIKQLIDQIPTEKSELFAWKMDWDQVDQSLLDSRVKPWVNKKISEYIGEEEPTLTDFICQKVMTKSSAQSILTDVAMVLDDEAETFVVKMWRLLVYETEAKKAGLVK